MTNHPTKTAALAFDPTAFGFIALDYKMPSVQFFELRIDAAHPTAPNFNRLNYYLTQDGPFVTIYFGLLESWVTSARLQPQITACFA